MNESLLLAMLEKMPLGFRQQLVSESQRLLSEVSNDQAATLILKGHLLIEEGLWNIIAASVSHPHHLLGIRLEFSRKVALARSMSPAAADPHGWELILKLNKVRNSLAHSLSGAERNKAMAALVLSYEHYKQHSIAPLDPIEQESEIDMLGTIIGVCLGFVLRVEWEIKQKSTERGETTLDPAS
jgi:hypothetical protein